MGIELKIDRLGKEERNRRRIDEKGRKIRRGEEYNIIYNSSIIIVMYITPNVKLQTLKPRNINPTRYAPNINNHSPSKHQKLNTYKYAPHTSTIHSDKTCGVELSDLEYWKDLKRI